MQVLGGSRDKITFLIGHIAFDHASGAALFNYACCYSQSRVVQLDRERLSPLREDESKNKVLWKVDADPAAGKTPIDNLDQIEYRKVPKGFIEEGFFKAECVDPHSIKFPDSRPRAVAFAGSSAWLSYDNGRVLTSIDGGETWCDLLKPEEVWQPGEERGFFANYISLIP